MELSQVYTSFLKCFGLANQDLKKPVDEESLEKISTVLTVSFTLLEDTNAGQGLTKEPAEKQDHYLHQWKASRGSEASFENLIFDLLGKGYVGDAERVVELFLKKPGLCKSNSTAIAELKASSFKVCEDKLVEALTEADLESLLGEAVEMRLISQAVHKTFKSFEFIPSPPPSLKIRYLLMHAYEGLMSDPGQCELWLEVLRKHGVPGHLVGQLSQVSPNHPRTSLKGHDSVSSCGASVGGSIWQVTESDSSHTHKLSSGPTGTLETRYFLDHHVSQLTELLASCSMKCKEIGLSLNLPSNLLDEIAVMMLVQGSKFSLSRVLREWVVGRHEHAKAPTVANLKTALASQLVDLGAEVGKLEENLAKHGIRFKVEQTVFKTTSELGLKIVRQSCDTEVAEGKSALLKVSAVATCGADIDYQWVKDNTVLKDTAENSYLGTNMPILCISKATIASRGTYTCRLKTVTSDTSSSVSAESEPIQVTVKTSQVKEILLSMYSKLPDVQTDARIGMGGKTFINLALIKETEVTTEFAWSTIQGNADDVKAEKEAIEYSTVFREYESGFLQLIEGRPGSGKTTLVHKVTKDWAKGEDILKGADLVFLIPLRALPKENNLELFDVLKEFFFNDSDLTSSALELVRRKNGDGVCFILDGLDEYQTNEEETSIIFKLIQKTYLHNSMVIVASRPIAAAELRPRSQVCIEVLGFLREQIFEYIDSYNFPGASSDRVEKAQSLKSYLEEHSNVFRMCYLPIHAFMICLLHDKIIKSLIQTESGVYKYFTLHALSRKMSQKKAVTSFNKLPADKKVCFDQICKIAFEMTLSHQLVFEDDESLLADSADGDSSLGLITIDITPGDMFLGLKSLYSFVHLTYQEYLAACHLSSLEEAQQVELLKKYGGQSHMHVVLKFFCGLVNFQGHKSKIFEEIVKLQEDSLFLCQCAFESQQEVACSLVNSGNEELSFKDKTLNPSDCVAIEFVISKTVSRLSQLTLANCSLGESAKYIPNCLQLCSSLLSLDMSNTNLSKSFRNIFASLAECHALQRLNLSNCDIGNDGAISLANTLKFFHGFESLSLDHNGIGDRGVEALCAALKQHQSLKKLCFSRNNISYVGANCIADALECTINLLSLDIASNSLKDPAIASLAQGLKHCKKLESLILDHDVIRSRGIRALSISLTFCTKLQTLSINNALYLNDLGVILLSQSFNSLADLRVLKLARNGLKIDDAYAKVFARSLSHSNDLQELDLSNNKLGDAVAIALSERLEHCKCLTSLNLSENAIGDSGIKSLVKCFNFKSLRINHNRIGNIGEVAIAGGLKQSVDLVHLDLSWCYIESVEGVMAIAEGLEYCASLEVLNLDYNRIGDGIIHISIKLKCLRKLHTLQLLSNRITDTGAVALAEGLKFANNNLQLINLSENKIEDIGAQALGECLKYCSSSLQSISLTNNKIGNAGIEGLSKGIGHCRNLTNLYLATNNFSDEGAISLSRSISNCNKLKILNLFGNRFGEDGVCALAEALKECKTLEKFILMSIKFQARGAQALAQYCSMQRTLDLMHRDIGSKGALQLAEGLKSCSNIENLKLQKNDIGDIGAEALSNGLRFCKSLKNLQLSQNNIGDVGITAIARSLKYCHNLEELDVRTNVIGDVGTKGLAQGLSHCTNLVKLDLLGNKICDIECLSHCTSLKKLILSKNKVRAKSLVGGLSHCINLQTLSLSCNQIGDEGAEALVEGLSRCANLISLSLNHNQIGDPGAEKLAEVLRTCKAMKDLQLSHNLIGDAGAKGLASWLSYGINLRKLKLNCNQIGDAGAKDLASGLSHCINLASLSLEDNKFGDGGIEGLADGLSYCINLETLFLEGNQNSDLGARCLVKGLCHCISLRIWITTFGSMGVKKGDPLGIRGDGKRKQKVLLEKKPK